MSSFGRRLKKLRVEKKAKQEELALMLGISRTAVSKYENDDREPDMKTIAALTNYFDVSVDYMFGRTAVRGKTDYIPSNLKLIMGNKSLEEFKSDIDNEIGVLFDPRDLKDYLSGDSLPSLKSVQAFADYANVDIDFFYRRNDPDSLEKARHERKKNPDNFPDSKIVEEIIRHRGFIRLAHWIKEHDISPDDVIKLMNNLFHLNKKKQPKKPL